MKATRIIYWLSTILVSLMMLYAAYNYLTNPALTDTFHHLGYPDYFRIELAVAKIIGVLVLLIPFYGRSKEWAYAGFTIVLISAFIAHVSSGDPIKVRVLPLIFLVLLAISYITYHKLPKKAMEIELT